MCGGQTGVAQLPRFALIFGNRDARYPTRYGDALVIRRIERDVVQIAAETDAAEGLECLRAIVRSEQAAFLCYRQPVAGIVWRLLDAGDLKACRASELPIFAGIFAAEDSLLTAYDEHACALTVDANGLSVLCDAVRRLAPASVAPRS